MLNKEKFKDKIVELACCGHDFALKDGKVVDCQDMPCRECGFSSSTNILCCGANRKNWANSEYEEYVDWSKVPVDTKILVRDDVRESWTPRHFAGIEREHGFICTFEWGGTSFTSYGKTRLWKYAKLYKEEEECTK